MYVVKIKVSNNTPTGSGFEEENSPLLLVCYGLRKDA